MKLLNILAHPVLLIISFSLVLVIGEKFSGFYIVYILMALIELYLHAIWAVIGALLLAVGHQMLDKTRRVINIAGSLFLVLSLFTFFYNDKDHYNWDTFYHVKSLVSLGIFGLLWLVFVLKNISLVKRLDQRENTSTLLSKT